MSEPVAEIPEEAVKAVARDLYMLDPDQDPDETEIGEAVRVIGHVLSALPSEWLLARALSKKEIKQLQHGAPTFRSDYATWDSAVSKLRAALPVLEQEAGGER